MSNYSGSIPDTAARPLDWMDRMACRDKRELFDDPTREHEARTVCINDCPVRTQCLAYVQRLEDGASRTQRDGVVAGLTHRERWRCDAAAYRCNIDAPALDFTGDPPRCGTHIALLKHLWLDEPIDAKCWSGEVHRDHESRSRREHTHSMPEPEPVIEQKPPVQLVTKAKPPARGDNPHERRIYTLWSSGLSDLDIARRMAVSVPSVQRARERLGLLANLPARKAS